MCLETLMKVKAESAEFQKFFSLFLYLYPLIFISQINLASFTGSSATQNISRLVHICGKLVEKFLFKLPLPFRVIK